MKHSCPSQEHWFQSLGACVMGCMVLGACDANSPAVAENVGGRHGTTPSLAGTAGSPATPAHVAPSIADSPSSTALAHLPLATAQPRVLAIATAQRALDAIVVLAETDSTEEHVRLSLRQALPTRDPPDLSKVWATQDLPAARDLARLSAAVYGGDRIAIYYGYASSTGPSPTTRFGLLRYDNEGSLLRGPNEDALTNSISSNAACELSPASDAVVLTCADTGRLVLVSCSGAEPCRSPVEIDPNTGATFAPSAIATDTEFQLFYEVAVNGKHALRRTVVDRATLTVTTRQDLLQLPLATAVSKASAIRVGAEVIATFGFPQQVGAWSLDGTGLRVSTADPASEQWGAYWVDSHRYGPMMEAAGFLYVLEWTPYAQLDVFGTAAKLLRIEPSSLATQTVANPPKTAAFYANGARRGLYQSDHSGLVYLTLPNDASEPIGCFDALPGIVPTAFQGIRCDTDQCRVLMRRAVKACPNQDLDEELGLWSVRRDFGQVARPAFPRLEGNMRGTTLAMTPERTVLSYGAETDAKGATLEIYGAPEEAPAIVPVNSPGIARGSMEGDQLRLFLYTDQPHVYDYGFLEGNQIAVEGRTDAIDLSHLCYGDGFYYSITPRETSNATLPTFDVYRIDPNDAMRAERLGSFATSDGFEWGISYCSRDRLFFVDSKYEEDSPTPAPDAFAQVRTLDGSLVARVALPKRVTPFDFAAVAGHFYVVWTNPDDASMIGVTILDRDGHPTQTLLPMPPGQRWSTVGPVEISAGELRMPWLAKDGTPMLSIWRLYTET